LIDNNPQLSILDCTVRDGNYAVDFKFTEADTALLTQQLVHHGFKWIEVGHGLGLGGSEAGKGEMPASDIELIRAAKAEGKDAKVGMFFIPGIGTMEHLDMARDAGLDFVRIGYEATEIEVAFPFIQRARELGIAPCLNYMKSYAISPEDFARKAKDAVEVGAEIIYCVDSAGSMMPTDVAQYFDAVRAEVPDCQMGFHGHNNLMMVIANCIAAYDHGVRFLDATLSGLGRSAGNAPSEILVAVMERLGVSTGVDLFGLMDSIETFIWPLVSQTRPHDMLAVTGGYSQFHSSYLPRVASVAREYRVELRRLVAKVAFHDPVNLDEGYLEIAARELQGTQTVLPSDALLSFNAPEITRQRINTSLESVQTLVDGLSVSNAKRSGAYSVLHLVPNTTIANNMVLPDFVMEDAQTVLGRVTYGSLDILHRVIDRAKVAINFFLVEASTGWAEGAAEIVAERVGENRMVIVRDRMIYRQFIAELIDNAAQRCGKEALLVYGADPVIAEILTEDSLFEKVFFAAQVPSETGGENRVNIGDLGDWQHLNIEFNVILCSSNPQESDTWNLVHMLAPKGKVMALTPATTTLQQAVGADLIQLNPHLAYSGIIARHLSLLSMFRGSNSEKGDW
jgi:4-hydroxy 2-oxovalerate aldolase